MNMRPEEWWKAFLALDIPEVQSDENGEAAGTYRTISLSLDGRHLIGKDRRSQPALLIREEQHPKHGVPLELEYISLQYGQRCTIEPEAPTTAASRSDCLDEQRVTILRCLSNSLAIQREFVQLMAVLVGSYGGEAQYGDTERVLAGLVELLQAASSPSARSVIGLWGELVVLLESEDTPRAIEAWHQDPKELFDFSSRDCRLEVKTTSRSERSHIFKLDQLTSPGSPILVATIMTVNQSGGTSVPEVIELIERKVKDRPDLVERLRVTAAITLGCDIIEAHERHFDLAMAQDSLRVIPAEAIPQPPAKSLPSEVTDVTFRAGLTTCLPLDDPDVVRELASLGISLPAAV